MLWVVLIFFISRAAGRTHTRKLVEIIVALHRAFARMSSSERQASAKKCQAEVSCDPGSSWPEFIINPCSVAPLGSPGKTNIDAPACPCECWIPFRLWFVSRLGRPLGSNRILVLPCTRTIACCTGGFVLTQLRGTRSTLVLITVKRAVTRSVRCALRRNANDAIHEIQAHNPHPRRSIQPPRADSNGHWLARTSTHGT